MTKENPVLTALDSLGFEHKGSVSFGLWNGYAAALDLSSGSYLLNIAVRFDAKDKELDKSLRRLLNESSCRHRIGVNSSSKNTLLVFSLRAFNRKSPYEQQFAEYMDCTTEILRQLGINPAETCALCGGGGPDSLCCCDGYQPVHSSCIRRMQEQAKEDVQNNQQNGSYLTGFLGALIGALVGLIPTILVILLTDTIYAILFALVPMAAAFGYRRLNGKKDKASIAIIILLSFISVFVLEFIIIGIQVAQENSIGFGTAMSAVFSALLNFQGLGLIIQDSLMELFFMLLGVIFSWNMISKTNASGMSSISAIAETLRPNPAYGAGFSSQYEGSNQGRSV